MDDNGTDTRKNEHRQQAEQQRKKYAESSRKDYFIRKNELRQQAEQQMQQTLLALDDRAYNDVKTVLHELYIHQIELTLQNEALQEAQADLEASRMRYAGLYEKYLELYDLAPVGYCTLDPEGRISNINLTAAAQLGCERAALLDTRLYQYLLPEDRDTFFLHLRRAFDTHSRQTCELRLCQRDGTIFWGQIESRVFEVEEDDCEAWCCQTTVTDISRRKTVEAELSTALQENRTLLQEVYHRTKNNMQTIESMLRLQAAYSPHDEVQRILGDSQRRIQAMALVHQKLYQAQNLAEINLQGYIRELADLLIRSYSISPQKIACIVEAEPLSVRLDTAIPCGLLINELLSNAIEHGFPDGRQGDIRVCLFKPTASDIELCVANTGVALPHDFDYRHQESLGLQLVVLLGEHQLHGSVRLETEPDVAWHVRFPDPLAARS